MASNTLTGSKVFCGVEGGASVSRLVLITDTGDVLTCVSGPCTNHLLVGLDECQRRLTEMIIEAKVNVNIPAEEKLAGLGLSMSGCEMEEANLDFEKAFLKRFPEISDNCKVVSDTVGALLSASPKGGLVLIAGTGSNALLINPDGSTARCGGWGHLIGDEASAMWISLKAVKTIFDAEDNLVAPPYDICRVKQLMLEHFGVEDKFGILEHCYVNFSKSFFAGLCAKLARAAMHEGDSLCQHLFREAGRVMARVVKAIAPNIQQDLLKVEGGFPILCVGSVFKSWELLRPGFEECIGSTFDEFSLLTLDCSAAVGAAYLAAKECGTDLPLDTKSNTSILYHYKK